MDAEYASAFAEIKNAILVLAQAMQGLKGGSGGNAGPHTGTAHAPPAEFHGFTSADADWSQKTTLDPATNKRTFNEDYWYVGIPGAQKGTDLDVWGAANNMMGMKGESKPHLYVVMNSPTGVDWSLVTKSAADAGWMDGSAYVPDPALTAGQRFAAWDAVGRPSVSADGFLLQRGGDYVTNSSGQKVPPGSDPGFRVTP